MAICIEGVGFIGLDIAWRGLLFPFELGTYISRTIYKIIFHTP